MRKTSFMDYSREWVNILIFLSILIVFGILTYLYWSQEWLKMLMAIIIPVFTAVLTYMNYIKQKEHELVRKRYLDDGLDQFIGNFEQILSVFRHNWALSLSFIKSRHQKYFSANLRNVDQTGMNICAAHRIGKLIKDNCVWDGIQEAFAFVEASNTFFRILEGINIPDEDTLCKYKLELEQLEKDSHIYYMFLTKLLDLSSILEREKFTFASIGAFHNRENVPQIVATLKDLAKKMKSTS